MPEHASIWALTILSFAMIVSAFFLTKQRSILVFISFFYFYFAFGPVINFLLGNEIYKGTLVWNIRSAALMFTMAIAAMLTVAIAIPQKQHFDLQRGYRQKEYVLIPFVLGFLGLYSGLILLLRGPHLIGLAKPDKVALVGGFHYTYLLLEFMVLSLYFVIMHTNFTRKIYWANFGLYLLYCVVTAERDFIFIIFGLLIYKIVTSGNKPNIVSAVGALVGLYLATLMFSIRGGGGVSFASILNQGSLLFVDTTVLEIVPKRVPYFDGYTYVNAIANLLPSRLHTTGLNLSQWLVDWYVPGANAGYGFSLSAEAYMNFGIFGVPVVFAAISAIQGTLVNRFDRSDFGSYFAVFFTSFWMYSFRNDSFALIKGCLYAVIFFVLLETLSNPAWIPLKRNAASNAVHMTSTFSGANPGKSAIGKARPRRA